MPPGILQYVEADYSTSDVAIGTVFSNDKGVIIDSISIAYKGDLGMNASGENQLVNVSMVW